MSTTYTFDVFCSLDGYGAASANWSGYWGKQGPELLDHRLALYDEDQRMVFGANTFRAFTEMLASSTEDSEVRDPWVTRMVSLPATVVSSTLEEPLDWPDATVVRGDAVDVVRRLKQESAVPLRSHGSLSLNRALLGAGLVDRVQVTLFPVITGQTGLAPIFHGAADFRPGAAGEPDPRRPHPGARLPADSALTEQALDAGRPGMKAEGGVPIARDVALDRPTGDRGSLMPTGASRRRGEIPHDDVRDRPPMWPRLAHDEVAIGGRSTRAVQQGTSDRTSARGSATPWAYARQSSVPWNWSPTPELFVLLATRSGWWKSMAPTVPSVDVLAPSTVMP
jgi:dihydrofolate reductase